MPLYDVTYGQETATVQAEHVYADSNGSVLFYNGERRTDDVQAYFHSVRGVVVRRREPRLPRFATLVDKIHDQETVEEGLWKTQFTVTDPNAKRDPQEKLTITRDE